MKRSSARVMPTLLRTLPAWLTLLICLLGLASLRWTVRYLGSDWILALQSGNLTLETGVDDGLTYYHTGLWIDPGQAFKFAWPHREREYSSQERRRWLIDLRLAVFPFWLGVLVAPFVGVAMRETVWQVLHGIRHRHGNCTHCGYCLIGNISGVCPECGTTLLSAADHLT